MTHQSRASGLATGIISRRPGAQSSIEASFLFPSRGASEPVILSAEGAKDLPVGSLDTSSTIRSPISRVPSRSEEHTSELQSRGHLVCRLLLEKKKTHLLYQHMSIR